MRVMIVQSVITWALVQNIAGNLQGTSSWYPPPPYPPRPLLTPPLPPAPVIVPAQPVCPEWGNNVVNPLLPFPLGPIGGGVVGEGCACSGYSIQVCPFSIQPSEGRDQIVEIKDDKIIDETAGRIISDQREVFDVTNQFYPNYPYPYYPPSPPPYPYYPPPSLFQPGASRSLGDE